MALSKRLRFEILRRDNHTCRYCGATAPGTKILVDHVVPEALGGRSVPENLVAACEPCNSGKSSISPDAATTTQVADDAVRWARAMEAAAGAMVAERQQREAELGEFYEAWERGRAFARLPDNWDSSVLRLRAAGLPLQLILDAASEAHANRTVAGPDVFRYMCGICWSTITELQQAAREMVGGESRGEVLSARDQLAGHLLRIIEEQLPEITESSTGAAYSDLTQAPSDRVVPGEESIHVLTVANAIYALLGYIHRFLLVTHAGFRRLAVEDQTQVEEQLASDIYVDDDEAASDQVDRVLRLLRHMLALAERTDI